MALTLKALRVSSLALGVVAGAACVVGVSEQASAIAISEGNGDSRIAPYFNTLVINGVDRGSDGSFGFPEADNEVNIFDYTSNTGPRPLTSITSSFSVNGANFIGSGQTQETGFFNARNFSQITVTNSNPNDAYSGLSGSGSVRSVQFVSPSEQAAMARFTWTVTGSESNSSVYGRNLARLDFGATTASGVSWYDLFVEGPGNPLNSITRFGPGTYSYDLPIVALGTPINLYYWSAVLAEVRAGEAPAGSNFTLTADYSNTFTISQVQLFDQNNAPISNWTLRDLNFSQDVFDQNGRIDPSSAVPVPPQFLATALGAGIGALKLRRQKARAEA
jgi:hypothetical protein